MCNTIPHLRFLHESPEGPGLDLETGQTVQGRDTQTPPPPAQCMLPMMLDVQRTMSRKVANAVFSESGGVGH